MKRWRGRLAITILVVLFAVGSWACEDISWDTGGERRDWGERYPGPRGRKVYGEDVRCFDTFGKFKRAMEKEGRKKLGYQWHHIVAQHPGNKKQFGERNLHCTDNLVYLSTEDHEKINGHYSRKQKDLGERSLRDYLRDKDFDTQYRRGCDALKEQNVTYTEPLCP